MKFMNLLQEGRVEDFTKKFASKFSQNQLSQIIELSKDLPGNNKYLMWLGNVLDPTNFDGALEKLNVMLNRFYEVSNKLERKEIEKYQSIEDLLNTLDEYQNRVRRTVETVEGSDVVYDDENFTVVAPYTYKASCYYGKGTKWCTASKDSSSYFNKYNNEGKLFYFLDKKKRTSDNFYKVAYVYGFERGNDKFYDARDKTFNEGWLIGTDYLNGILEKIDEYVKSKYPKELEIFADEKRRREEKERIERERQQNIIRQKRNEADERRQNNYFEYGVKDGEAEYAWALYLYLVNNGEFDGHDEDEILEYYRIRNERDGLNDELSSGVGEERESEIEERIDEIDELISEYLETPDIYYLIPTSYGYYGLKVFEILESSQEWVVGLTSNIEEAAVEYEKNLIDDIGLEGFNESFLSDYIDEDKVRDTAREIYNSWVYDDPDSYFNESDKELSRNQEEAINSIDAQIEDKRESISNLKEELEELEGRDDDEWDQDSIDDIENQISDLESEISDLEYEIEDIKENPDGDYPDDMIEEKIDELVDDAMSDPLGFLKEYDFKISEYVDADEVAQGVVDTDGVEVMAPYDGVVNEEDYLDTEFSIFRYN